MYIIKSNYCQFWVVYMFDSFKMCCYSWKFHTCTFLNLYIVHIVWIYIYICIIYISLNLTVHRLQLYSASVHRPIVLMSSQNDPPPPTSTAQTLLFMLTSPSPGAFWGTPTTSCHVTKLYFSDYFSYYDLPRLRWLYKLSVYICVMLWTQ